MRLTLVNANNYHITANLRPEFVPGDYLLRLEAGNPRRAVFFEVTLGPIGPRALQVRKGTRASRGSRAPREIPAPRAHKASRATPASRGPIGGQVWSSNFQLPATITSGMSSAGIVALPCGSGGVASQNVPASVLQVPRNCTASGFTVVQFGASNTSTAQALLAVGTNTSVASSFLTSTSFACTLTANSGGFSSCSASGTASLTAGQLIAFGFFNFSQLADFQNARIMASFTCQ